MKRYFLILMCAVLCLSVMGCRRDDAESAVESSLEDSVEVSEIASSYESEETESSDGSEEVSEEIPDIKLEDIKLAEDFSWSFENGVLTFYGHGSTPDYEPGQRYPWDDIREEVLEVVVSEGITRLGSCCVVGFLNASKITLPETLTAIGYAGLGTNGITELKLPSNVKYLDEDCFSFNINLKTVTISKGVEEIPNGAFFGCRILTDIYFEGNIKRIGGLIIADETNWKGRPKTLHFSNMTLEQFKAAEKDTEKGTHWLTGGYVYRPSEAMLTLKFADCELTTEDIYNIFWRESDAS